MAIVMSCIVSSYMVLTELRRVDGEGRELGVVSRVARSGRGFEWDGSKAKWIVETEEYCGKVK